MDQTAVGLRAAIRALADVVASAVDPQQAQASEQLRLSIDGLEFVLARLDHLHDRERFELRHQRTMAMALQQALAQAAVGATMAAEAAAEASPLAAALQRAIERGDAAWHDAAASMASLRSATAALAAAVAAIVRAAPDWDGTVRRGIERCVVQASREHVAFERSWYLPLGFDPDAADVLPLAHWFERPAAGSP